MTEEFKYRPGRPDMFHTFQCNAEDSARYVSVGGVNRYKFTKGVDILNQLQWIPGTVPVGMHKFRFHLTTDPVLDEFYVYVGTLREMMELQQSVVFETILEA